MADQLVWICFDFFMQLAPCLEGFILLTRHFSQVGFFLYNHGQRSQKSILEIKYMTPLKFQEGDLAPCQGGSGLPRRVDFRLTYLDAMISIQPACFSQSPALLRRKADFLVGFPWLSRADLNGDFSIKPLKQTEQLIHGETTEMTVHQMRYVRLRHAEQLGNFTLFKVFLLKDFIDAIAHPRSHEKLVRIFNPQVRKNVAGAFFKLDF